MAGYNVIKTQKALPIGSVQPWGGNVSEIPNGWLLCNGAELEAGDYPLLARILRNTYGGTAFSGVFPNYTGTFRLPQTNNKALADISTAYFGTYTTTGSIPSEIDNLAALTVVQEFLGDYTPGFEPGDLGPPNVTNAKTDLNFTYTPDPPGTIVSIISSGTAPDVLSAKQYKNVVATGGTGFDAQFTVVISPGDPDDPGNPDPAYYIIPKVKGQGYEIGDQLTIPGSTFAADGGESTANDISITITNVGSSYFEGTITGQSLIEGFSIKEVYVIPRKLGRKHFPQHFHEGTYKTTSTSDAGANPGRGVCVFATPEVNFEEFYARVDPCPDNYVYNVGLPLCPLDTALRCAPTTTYGPSEFSVESIQTGFWIGNSPTDNITSLDNCPFTPGRGRYAIASVGGTLPVVEHKPYLTSSTGHGVGKSWFTGESPDVHWNLRDASGATSASTGPSDEALNDLDMIDLKTTGHFGVNYRIPFSDHAQRIKSPNFDPGAGGDGETYPPNGGYTKTLFNHAGISFAKETLTGGGVQDVIEAHDHDGSVNIVYDGSNMNVVEQLQVLAQPYVTPNSIAGALQITFTTRVASITITNLIRAY